MTGAARAALLHHDTRRAIAGALDLLRAGPPLLIVTDFDGTLAPIVAEPGDARILPSARRALRTLARLADMPHAPVWVVLLSGRTAADVAGRVRVGGLRYVGLHGMEAGTLPRRAAAERLVVHAAGPGSSRSAETGSDSATALAHRVAHRLGSPRWLSVEPKGPTAALHFRRAPDAAAARAEVLAALDAEDASAPGPRLLRMESRRVVELRPAGAAGKGEALLGLIEDLRPAAVLAMGDDVTDAGMFEVVRAARAGEAGPARIPGIAIGVRGGPETPQAILDTADVLVAGPHQAARVLAALARAVAVAAEERTRAP